MRRGRSAAAHVGDETIAGVRHVYECPMRWADLDLQQHVNNVKYLDYLQDARVDLFRTHAPAMRAEATADLSEALVVVSHDISYLAPLSLHHSVTVECWVSQVRAASFTISYEIVSRRGEGERLVHATASTVLAPFVFADERPRRITADEKALLATLRDEPSDEPSDEPRDEPSGPTGAESGPQAPAEPLRFAEPWITPEGTYSQHVRFSDVDAYGHVNNVTYLEYLQEARIAFMSRLRKELEDPGATAFVVARAQIAYVSPMLHRPEPYTSHSWIERVGTKSMVVETRIGDGELVNARGRVVMVSFDTATQRSAAPSAEMRDLLDRWTAPADR